MSVGRFFLVGEEGLRMVLFLGLDEDVVVVKPKRADRLLRRLCSFDEVDDVECESECEGTGILGSILRALLPDVRLADEERALLDAGTAG